MIALWLKCTSSWRLGQSSGSSSGISVTPPSQDGSYRYWLPIIPISTLESKDLNRMLGATLNAKRPLSHSRTSLGCFGQKIPRDNPDNHLFRRCNRLSKSNKYVDTHRRRNSCWMYPFHDLDRASYSVRSLAFEIPSVGERICVPWWSSWGSVSTSNACPKLETDSL
jgi:hypothetical protein